jgi:hypothetical protein
LIAAVFQTAKAFFFPKAVLILRGLAEAVLASKTILFDESPAIGQQYQNGTRANLLKANRGEVPEWLNGTVCFYETAGAVKVKLVLPLLFPY